MYGGIIMKNLKRKILVGALSLSLVLGAGSALAASDAGAQLQTWYNTKFGVAVTDMTTEVTNYGKSLVSGLLTWLKGEKTTATNEVTTAADQEITETNSAITAAKDEHIAAINSKKNQIEAGMPAQFDDLEAKGKAAIDKLAIAGVAYAEGELKRNIDNAGDTQVSKVNTQVAAHKDTAVTDLTNAISTAKNDLEDKIGKESADTVDNVKDYIDDEIVRNKGIVEKYADVQVAEKVVELETTGATLQADALAELDALVVGIND